MSLYDDLDTKARTSEKVAGWSSGIKLLQSQLQLKKAAVTQPKRDAMRRSAQVLTPVIDLKSKQKEEEEEEQSELPYEQANTQAALSSTINVKEFDWNIVDEYDPMWPNDYDKVAKEMQVKRLQDGPDRSDRTDRKRKSRFGDEEDIIPEKTLVPMQPEEEEVEEINKRAAGAAIAPPPSLTAEAASPPSLTIPSAPSGGFSIGGYGASSVAAKIMAKYGFKEGQGLGKKEQGMSVALQVEKTSKRGGRIIHEKDAPPPMLPPTGFIMPAPPGSDSPNASNSPQMSKEPSITEIMKTPSKVVLLRNMVGPGDVDEELEPEVKDECNTKYGDVVKVVIYEIPNVVPEDAVRIFVEFKRIESAIKAVVDLNGRFFGGRQVRAGFYEIEKFNAYQLSE